MLYTCFSAYVCLVVHCTAYAFGAIFSSIIPHGMCQFLASLCEGVYSLAPPIEVSHMRVPKKTKAIVKATWRAFEDAKAFDALISFDIGTRRMNVYQGSSQGGFGEYISHRPLHKLRRYA